MVNDPPPPAGRLPLSVVVDRMAGAGPRGRPFVRQFADWFAGQAPHLHLAPLDALGLVDVVLTFRLRQDVTLVATGRRPDHPGEVTVHFAERDLPFVDLLVDKTQRSQPYEVCTMDYAVRGRPVELTTPVERGGRAWPAGTPGVALVETYVGLRRHLRVRLATTPPAELNLPLQSVRWIDQADADAPGG